MESQRVVLELTVANIKPSSETLLGITSETDTNLMKNALSDERNSKSAQRYGKILKAAHTTKLNKHKQGLEQGFNRFTTPLYIS